jgi:hypothetical protein
MPRINWSQAAGEAFLILLGILLALGADAWWDERSERRQEAEYLDALVAELDQMRSHVEGVIRTTEQIEDAGSALLQVVPNWDTFETDSLGVLLVTVSHEVGWAPPNTVYQDLINTGAVGIIRSESVRRGLNELMGTLAWVESRQVRHDEFFWSEMDPFYRQHLSIASLFGYEELPSEPWAPGNFLATTEFRNLISAKVMTAGDVGDAAEELIDLIERLSETITRAAGAL